MNVQLKNYQLSNFESKSKLYSYLNTMLTKAYFKIEDGKFSIILKSPSGMARTNVDIEYNGGEKVYFSMEFAKWVNAINKFSSFEAVNISIKENILNISAEDSSDNINFGITRYEEDSQEANAIDTFLENKKKFVLSAQKKLEITDELLSDFQFSDNLFSSQGNVNSIALTQTHVIYSDRSVVSRVRLSECLSDELFEGLSEDEPNIYIHTSFLKLFNLIYKMNPSVYFSEDYDEIYWTDNESTEISLVSEPHSVAIPTEEEFNSIKPFDEENNFSVTLGAFKNSLDFFNGFLEGSVWKPLNVIVDNGVTLKYSQTTTNLKKVLTEVSEGKGSFIIDADMMRKIVSKASERFTKEDATIEVVFDEDSPGVYCSINDTFEIVVSKLSDD